MPKAGNMIKIEAIIGAIKISEIRITLQVMGIKANMRKVIEENFKDRKGDMTEAGGIEIIEEDLVGIKETVDLEIEVDEPLGIKVKRKGVITVENQDIL